MNYLISAYSINPYNGSEDSIGWNWVLQHEKNWKEGDRIILITKKFNEEDTKRGLTEYGLMHVELVIVDVPNTLNWFREKYSMFHHMYYILWQHYAWLWVKKSGIKFDVIHHVTMNDYRIPSEMYKCKGAKVVWGPVGGAQTTPKSLEVYEENLKAARFRSLINKSCSWNPFYARAVKSYDWIYCINTETQQQLEKIVNHEIPILPELALRDDLKNMEVFKTDSKVTRIVFVGRLIGKKGIAFLVDALTELPQDFEWKLEIYGDGHSKPVIEKKIIDSGLSNKITMMGNRPLSLIKEAYQNADVFVLPSLRETSGNVLLEAMAFAIPIVAFDISFCSQLKEHNCGIFIDASQDIEKVKKDFADAILELGKNKSVAKRMGQEGYHFVNTFLTWDEKYQEIYKYLQ